MYRKKLKNSQNVQKMSENEPYFGFYIHQLLTNAKLIIPSSKIKSTVYPSHLPNPGLINPVHCIRSIVYE